jgi:hypothetical protein
VEVIEELAIGSAYGGIRDWDWDWARTEVDNEGAVGRIVETAEVDTENAPRVADTDVADAAFGCRFWVIGTGQGKAGVETTLSTKAEIDILSLRLEEEPDGCGACIVAESLKGNLVEAGTGGGSIAVEAGVDILGPGSIWLEAVVAARASGACGDGFALHGQTHRMASMKLVASELFWKFIWKRR